MADPVVHWHKVALLSKGALVNVDAPGEGWKPQTVLGHAWQEFHDDQPTDTWYDESGLRMTPDKVHECRIVDVARSWPFSSPQAP